MKQLEADRVISGYQAVLDRRAIGLDVLAFVRVRIDTHTQSEEQRFERSVRALARSMR